MWLHVGDRSRGSTRGQVICQVPSSATHVSYMCYSPDDQMIALSADKLIYIIDVKVCTCVTELSLILKLFFWYKKYDSTTKTLLETGLPSFDTVCANASFNFRSRWSHCNNSMVIMLRACSSY